jgi:hypothetical protein
MTSEFEEFEKWQEELKAEINFRNWHPETKFPKAVRADG